MDAEPDLPADPPAAKAALRRLLRTRRRAYVDGMDAATLDAALRQIADRVVAKFSGASVVAAYLAVAGEVDPAAILLAAHQQGRATALPAVESRAGALRFLRWAPGDPLVEGPMGLLQPLPSAAAIRPDLILAPLVGFDRRLGRLGQGASHYDRAFAALPDAVRIGLAWSVQEVPPLPVEPWDVPLHAVATEDEWIAA